VPGGNLYFLSGQKLAILQINSQNSEVDHLTLRGKTVNRSLALLGIASLAFAGTLFAQSTQTKSPATKKASGATKDSAAAKRGQEVFQQKCSVCHFDNSDAKKIGPGLKGLNKRGTFSVNGNKVTDENLKTWIENGDSLMPPFKDALEEAQIKDVIAYVKTL